MPWALHQLPARRETRINRSNFGYSTSHRGHGEEGGRGKLTAKSTETRSYENFIIRYSVHVTPYDYKANVARKRNLTTRRKFHGIDPIFDLNNTIWKCVKNDACGGDALFFYYTNFFSRTPGISRRDLIKDFQMYYIYKLFIVREIISKKRLVLWAI